MSQERTVRVSSDTRLQEAQPNRSKGGARQLWVREGSGNDEVSLLWAKTPWDDSKTVFVQSQILRLTVAADSTAAGDLKVRALSKRFSEANEKWNGKPGTTGTTETLAVGALSEGDTVDIDITAIGQTVAAGGRNKGVQLSTTATSRLRFYSSEHRHGPKIITTWSNEPAAPRILGAGLISKQFPAFGFDYEEATGDLTGVRLQIDAAADAGSPDFDSGLVTATEALFDTAGTAYGGLADGGSSWVRGLVAVSGVESDWSEWVQVTRDSHGTLVASSPIDGGTVTSPTPVLIGTFTPTGVEALTQQRIRVYNAARTKVLFDTGRQPAASSTTVAAAVPARWKGRRVIRNNTDAWSVLFEAWGNPERVDGPGDPSQVSAWADFTLTSGAPAAPTGLAATVTDGMPWADLTFTISPDAPDEIVVAVDNQIVAVLDPIDLNTGGTSYTYRLAALPPYQTASVKVAKVVDGVMSPWTAAVNVETTPKGVWVVAEDTGAAFTLAGVDVGNWAYSDQGAFYDPIGAPQQVRVVTSRQGMRGSFRGEIDTYKDLSYDDQMAALWAIKDAGEPVRLVAAQWSLPVELDDLSASPSPDFLTNRRVSLASFSFRQVDDFPWED